MKCLDCDNPALENNPRCLECKKLKSRFYYLRSKEDILQRKKVNEKARIDNHKSRIREYLENHPCVDCGCSDIICLDFDHVEDYKTADISKMLLWGYKWDKIEKEIGKCEVRCVRCHRIKTANQFSWWRLPGWIPEVKIPLPLKVCKICGSDKSIVKKRALCITCYNRESKARMRERRRNKSF